MFSDLHVHNWTDCAHVNGPTTDRLLDTLSVLDAVRVYALEHKIKSVVFGGDLTHTPGLLRTSATQLLVEALRRFVKDGITIYSDAGNHDFQDKSGVFNSIKILDLAGLLIAKSFVRINSDLAVGFVPYSDDTSSVYITAEQHYKRGADMIVYHHGFAGAKTFNEYIVRNPLQSKKLPKVSWSLSGHYHERQSLPGVDYIGSPLQHHRGEGTEPKGFIVIDTSTNITSFVALNTPRFVKVVGTDSVEDIEGNFVDLYVSEKEEFALRDVIRQARYVNVFRPEEVKKRVTRKTVQQAQTMHDMLNIYLREEGYPKSYNKLGRRLLNNHV